jgi:hypothetical protein
MYRIRSTAAMATAGLLLAGSVFAALACHDSGTTSPAAQRVAPSATRAAPVAKRGPSAMALWGIDQGKRRLRCVEAGSHTASASIGPEGGTLRVGRHRLIVPPGALSEPTVITGSVPSDSSATVAFEPSGLRFNVPAALVFGVKGCDVSGDDPSVMYIDDGGRPLEELRSVFDREREEVTVPIDHFSGYQVWV